MSEDLYSTIWGVKLRRSSTSLQSCEYRGIKVAPKSYFSQKLTFPGKTGQPRYFSEIGPLRYNLCTSGVRLDGLETKLDAVSDNMTSSMIDIDDRLESQSVAIEQVSSNLTELSQKIDKLELEDLPFLKKDRI